MEIIAHRGFRHRNILVNGAVALFAEHTENTIPAILGAMLQGFPVELDVHATREEDGHALVSHDDNISRIVAGESVNVRLSQSSLSDLTHKGLVGVGEKIPTLLEVLKSVEHRPERLYMELKSEGAAGAAIHAMGLFQKRCPDILSRMTVSSFAIRAIQNFRSAFPGTHIAWGIHQGTLKSKSDHERVRHIREFIRKGDITEVHLEKSLGESPGIVGWYQELGCSVKVWTVNTVAELRTVQDAGAEGIFSDFPEMMRSLLA